MDVPSATLDTSGGADAAAKAETVERLRSSLQRQTETIDSLHAAAQKYKTRLTALEQQATVKQAEIDSLKVLSAENAQLREQLLAANARNRQLELAAGISGGGGGAELQAQLSVKVQAYTRHNNFLQGEVALRDAKLAALQERLDVLAEEVHAKDRRVTILVEKLRQHSIDPNSAVSRVSVPEHVFNELKEKVATQGTTMELLREKLDESQEEAVRRDELVSALQRENRALKQSVSRLIAQINAGAATAIGSFSTVDQAMSPVGESKLRAYHAKRLSEYQTGAGGATR